MALLLLDGAVFGIPSHQWVEFFGLLIAGATAFRNAKQTGNAQVTANNASAIASAAHAVAQQAAPRADVTYGENGHSMPLRMKVEQIDRELHERAQIAHEQNEVWRDRLESIERRMREHEQHHAHAERRPKPKPARRRKNRIPITPSTQPT